MVASAFFTSNPTIYPTIDQARSDCLAQQQMVNAKARITLPMLTEVIPERVDPIFWVKRPQGIDPALIQKTLVFVATT